MTTLELGPSNMEVAMTVRAIRDGIIRNPSLKLYYGYQEGRWSESSDPVLFHNHIQRALAYADAGAYCLPADLPTESGEWVIRTDRFSGRRRDLFIETLDTHLGTHRLFVSPTPVTVYGITTNMI